MKNLIVIVRHTFIGMILGCLMVSCMAPEDNISPQSHKVVISGMQFQPAVLNVNNGDTIIFENRDLVVHDVTEEKSKSWKSAPLANGQTFSLVIKSSADYYCSIHPVMKGQILVDK